VANNTVNVIINAKNNLKAVVNDAKQDLDKFKGSIDSAKNTLLGLFGISLGGAFIKGLIETADKWLSLNAQIKNATSTQEEFVTSQQAVIDISRNTYTSLEANAGLFSKVNLAIKAMGGSSEQSIGTVDQVAKLVALSGTSAESAAAGIFQFTQSLAANRFSGQEYNSVAEQTPALLKAIYEGLNVNIGTLRKMAEEGALDTATVLGAIEKSTARTNAAFAKLPITFSKASQNMSNSWLEFVGRLNESEGVTSTLATGLNVVADNLDTLGEYLLKFLAIGFVIGLAKMTNGLLSSVQALKLMRLESQANAVATAQATAAEEARIVALYAEVAAQEADIRAKIADTEATIAVTQADLRSTQAMIANAATLQARAALVARITVLNGELSASQAVLIEQQTALSVVQTQGNLTMASMASSTNLLGAAIAGLVGWEIGSWAREQYVWVEKLGIAIAGVTHFIATGFDTSRQSGEMSKLASGYIEQFNAVGNESIKQTEARQDAEKKSTEQAKLNEEIKVKAIADSLKKSLDKIEQLSAVHKTAYDKDLRDLNTSEQQKLQTLEQALPARLGVEQKYQSTKQVIVQAAGAGEKQRLEQQVLIEIQANAQRLQLAKTLNDQKLADVTRVYDAEIALMKSRNLATDQLEKEARTAKKAILLDLEKSYEASIAKLDALDKQHRDKAIGYLNEINGVEKDRLTKLRELDLFESLITEHYRHITSGY